MKIYKQKKSKFMVGLKSFKKDCLRSIGHVFVGIIFVIMGVTFFTFNPGGLDMGWRIGTSLIICFSFGFNPIFILFVIAITFADKKTEWRSDELPEENEEVKFYSMSKWHSGYYDGYYFRSDDITSSYGAVKKYRKIKEV